MDHLKNYASSVVTITKTITRNFKFNAMADST